MVGSWRLCVADMLSLGFARARRTQLRTPPSYRLLAVVDFRIDRRAVSMRWLGSDGRELALEHARCSGHFHFERRQSFALVLYYINR